MTNATVEIIKASLKADRTISLEQRKRIIAMLPSPSVPPPAPTVKGPALNCSTTKLQSRLKLARNFTREVATSSTYAQLGANS